MFIICHCCINNYFFYVKNLEAMQNNCEGNGNDDEDCEVPVEDTFSGGMREGMESKKEEKTQEWNPPTVPNPPTTPTVPN